MSCGPLLRGGETEMIERYSRPRMKRVWSDESKYGKWLLIELAACEAWAEEGVIPREDLVALRKATFDVDRVNEEVARTRHDMPAFLRAVNETLGPESRWLHLGLTTSDVWDTTTSLQLTDSADLLAEEIDNLIGALRRRAREHKDTLMIGRTHGVHAEPITFGLKLAVWFDEMRRHAERLARAREGIAFGKLSGPVGTHATVPPSVEARVCQRLGLKAAPASNQVLQRDRHADFILTLALIAASLEKFATEIRGLQRTEIAEVSEPFPEGEAGSSSMPHKRNPELSERVCGLARLIRGHGVTALENVALWGERDISHSSAERVILPDATLALDYILSLMVGIVGDMGLPETHAPEHGLQPWRALLPAHNAGARRYRTRPRGGLRDLAPSGDAERRRRQGLPRSRTQRPVDRRPPVVGEARRGLRLRLLRPPCGRDIRARRARIDATAGCPIVHNDRRST